MPKYKMSELPTLHSDGFTYQNSYKASGIYFYARIDDEGEILDLGHNYEWKPIGLTRDGRLLSENNTCCIMFKNSAGDITWFHMQELNRL